MQNRLLSLDAEHALQLALKTARNACRQTRFLHRVHCVALFASGMASGEVARVLGGDARSVQRWVQRYKNAGLQGLEEASRSGRPTALPIGALHELQMAVANSPRMLAYSSDTWSSSLLQAEIVRRFDIRLSTRQCQRVLANLVVSESMA